MEVIPATADVAREVEPKFQLDFSIDVWWLGRQNYMNIKSELGGGGGFKYLLFSPLLGEMIQFDYIICLKRVETTI